MTIFLCGFMGCGKSTIGARLADLLNCPFIDMDNYIEIKSGMTIPQIFEQYGESYFRDLETQAIRDLSQQSGVIACGGGAMLRDENAQIARQHGLVMLLHVPFSVCYARISDSDRPLVRKNTPQQMETLYHDRSAIYQAHCTHCISADASPDAVADQILNILKEEQIS